MLPMAVAQSSSGGVTTSQGEGVILGEIVAAHCKVMGHYTVRCAKNDWTDRDAVLDDDASGPKNHVLDGGEDPPGEGTIFGGRPGHWKALTIFAAVSVFAAKGIIQLPITSCSRRADHSVCQASANSILKITGRRLCGLSNAKGVVVMWDCTARGRSLISTIALFSSASFRSLRPACVTRYSSYAIS